MTEDQHCKDKYLRVTNILYPFSGLSKIDPVVVAKAAERGTKVHKICEAIMLGLGEIGVDEQTKPYVESFKQWWNQGHDVLLMEKRFWCNELMITGQVDMILHTPEGLHIVDIKTSSKPSKTWPLQGSAYAYLARKAGYDIKKVFFLHLNKFGKEPKVYEYGIDESFFFAVYRIYKYIFQEE